MGPCISSTSLALTFRHLFWKHFSALQNGTIFEQNCAIPKLEKTICMTTIKFLGKKSISLKFQSTWQKILKYELHFLEIEYTQCVIWVHTYFFTFFRLEERLFKENFQQLPKSSSTHTVLVQSVSHRCTWCAKIMEVSNFLLDLRR